MRIAWGSLIFIYVFQYPLSQLMPGETLTPQFDWSDWVIAYSFVLCSVGIFMTALFAGLSGRPVRIYPFMKGNPIAIKRMSISLVILIVIVFGFWSYLMVDLKIGITIYTDFDPLPYRITGILFYGRLFLQPLILAYIAVGYADSKLKWFLLLLLVALGAWVSLTSGSRFAAIMFALPLALLFKGRNKYTVFGLVLVTYIIISSMSRTFYLPFVINDIDIINIYGSELAKEQDSAIEKILLLPMTYIIERSMGVSEVLLVLKFGAITPSFADSLQSFLAYFLPFISPGNSVSIKNIYGLSDDAFGGFGLGFFPNYWFIFGGSPILYFFGLSLIGWLLGKTYRQFAVGMVRFDLKGINILIFILLFILIYEARAYLFFVLLFVGWLFSKKNTVRILFSLQRAFTPRHVFQPPQ